MIQDIPVDEASGVAEPAGRSRRSVLATGAAVAGAAAGLVGLAACTVYEQPGGADESAPVDGGGDGGTTPKPFAQTSEVPVGGGTVFDQRRVVVTQPQAGSFKAFSAVCTHQGCLVADVRDGTINCPCHGSRFSMADGTVVQGPASRGLKERAITIEGTSMTLT